MVAAAVATSIGRRGGHRPARPSGLLPLRVLGAAALAVDAYVHADLAPGYDAIRADISQGELFRIESGAAALAALLVLLAGRWRPEWAFAFLVAASALGAVLLYRYVDVGRLGPLPNMYEPRWFAEKTASAVAEGVGVAVAAAGFLALRHRRMIV